jgi:hypothetical protein
MRSGARIPIEGLILLLLLRPTARFDAAGCQTLSGAVAIPSRVNPASPMPLCYRAMRRGANPVDTLRTDMKPPVRGPLPFAIARHAERVAAFGAPRGCLAAR